jgi:DNA processing protein
MRLDRERLYPWLAILRAKHMGSSRARTLEKHFGSVQKALNASVSEIAAIKGFTDEIGQSIHEAAQGKFDRDIDKELNWAEKEGVKLLLFSDKKYPHPLRNIPAPPALLYIKGTYKVEDILSFAIVGSRTASDRGRRLTNTIAKELAEYGLTIVSGLAWGIDASSHKGALGCKTGRTIAVLGNGLKFVYPKEHGLLADQIIKRGALITELFHDVSPQAKNFPPRNRIISGLSLGVLIAEAPSRSGSLITANYALEQGKDIFALPGDIEKSNSEGTNKLIQNSQATLVTSTEDILNELNDKITFYKNELEGKIPQVDLGPNIENLPTYTKDTKEPAIEIQTKEKPKKPTPQKPKIPSAVSLSEDEKSIYEKLGDDSQHIDTIARNLEWPVSRASSALGLLELKGLIEREAGMKFRVK